MHLNSLKDLGNQDINSKLLHIIDFIFWKNGTWQKEVVVKVASGVEIV